MRRVTSLLPIWDHSKSDNKGSFDFPRAWTESKCSSSSLSHQYSTLSAAELQMLTEPTVSTLENVSNKFEFESFWPSTIDKESDKAARILRSFCKEGFLLDNDQSSTSPSASRISQVLKVIPPRVIKEAVGLAIFTTIRAGLWISGAGGSGVLIARKENGEWSPPAGILLQTPGLIFSSGVDFYDCVMVINNRKAFNTMNKLRSTLGGGGEISASVGPVAKAGDYGDDISQDKLDCPVYSYLKSRGLNSNHEMNGTTIIGRNDENKRFYGRQICTSDIFSGKARHSSREIKMLIKVLKAAECPCDLSYEVTEQFANQPSYTDIEIASPRSASFGIPEVEDPDPFGVVALEKAGLEIRESGTRSRPPSSQFEYHPSPTSPIFARFNRMSIDTIASRSNRGSLMSTKTRASIDRGVQTVDIPNYDNNCPPSPPRTSPSCSERKQTIEEELERLEYSKIRLGPLDKSHNFSDDEDDKTSVSDNSIRLQHLAEQHSSLALSSSLSVPKITNKTDADHSELEDDEEPVIFEASSAQATNLRSGKNARGGLIVIPKRGPPPPLPARSSSRGTIDASTLNALRDQFEAAESRKPERRSIERKLMNSPRILIPISTGPLPDLKEHLDEKPFTTVFANSPSLV